MLKVSIYAKDNEDGGSSSNNALTKTLALYFAHQARYGSPSMMILAASLSGRVGENLKRAETRRVVLRP